MPAPIVATPITGASRHKDIMKKPLLTRSAASRRAHSAAVGANPPSGSAVNTTVSSSRMGTPVAGTRSSSPAVNTPVASRAGSPSISRGASRNSAIDASRAFSSGGRSMSADSTRSKGSVRSKSQSEVRSTMSQSPSIPTVRGGAINVYQTRPEDLTSYWGRVQESNAAYLARKAEEKRLAKESATTATPAKPSSRGAPSPVMGRATPLVSRAASSTGTPGTSKRPTSTRESSVTAECESTRPSRVVKASVATRSGASTPRSGSTLSTRGKSPIVVKPAPPAPSTTAKRPPASSVVSSRTSTPTGVVSKPKPKISAAPSVSGIRPNQNNPPTLAAPRAASMVSKAVGSPARSRSKTTAETTSRPARGASPAVPVTPAPTSAVRTKPKLSTTAVRPLPKIPAPTPSRSKTPPSSARGKVSALLSGLSTPRPGSFKK